MFQRCSESFWRVQMMYESPTDKSGVINTSLRDPRKHKGRSKRLCNLPRKHAGHSGCVRTPPRQKQGAFTTCPPPRQKKRGALKTCLTAPRKKRGALQTSLQGPRKPSGEQKVVAPRLNKLWARKTCQRCPETALSRAGARAARRRNKGVPRVYGPPSKSLGARKAHAQPRRNWSRPP